MSQRIERLNPQSLGAVASLLRRVGPIQTISAECLQRILFSDPDHDPELGEKIVEDGRVLGISCGVVRREGLGNPEAQGGDRPAFVKLLAVDVQHQGRGLGGELLERLESRFRERGARRVQVDGAAPAYLCPGLDVRLFRALGFFEKKGYGVIGERRSLDVAISDLSRLTEEVLAADGALREGGVQLRRASPEDADFLSGQVESAFSADWAWEVRLGLELHPPGVHIALSRGRLAGFAVSGVSGPDVFGPTGTLASHRKRGIGSTLLLRCLEDIRTRGHEHAIIGWLGPEEFYRRRLDAADLLRYHVLEKVL